MSAGDEPTVGGAVDIDAAVGLLYAGPPDDFVRGRDALARSLRAAGRRDEATVVKGLRKPKATARALDAARLHDPGAVDDLAAAVAALSTAQEGGGDVRAALGALRDAERAVTEAALAATAGEDRTVDASTVGAAVRAVLADPESLAALRAGRLVDVPAGGGFGLAGAGASTEAAPARAGAGRGTAASRRAAAPGGRPATGRRRDPRTAVTGEPAGAPATPDTARAAAGARTPTAPGGGEPRRLVEARRAVAEAEDALRLAADAADGEAPEVDRAEAAEETARREADAAARRADEARDAALAAARAATAARREAAALARRRDQAEAALAKARERLAKLEGS